MQFQHLLDERHHAVVTGHVGGVGKVDGTDGILLKVNSLEFRENSLEISVEKLPQPLSEFGVENAEYVLMRVIARESDSENIPSHTVWARIV